MTFKPIIFYAVFIGLMLLSANTFAACNKEAVSCRIDGNSYTAGSACYKDIKDCTDKAEAAGYGKTIHIPACAYGDCIWTGVQRIDLTHYMTIKGAGMDATYITIEQAPPTEASYTPVFKFTPDETSRNALDSLTSDTAFYEVSGITFKTPRLETLYLSEGPASSWNVGDTITGVSSGSTMTIVTILSGTKYYIKNRTLPLAAAEKLSNGAATGTYSLLDAPDNMPLMFRNDYTPVVRRIRLHDLRFDHTQRAVYSEGMIYGVFYDNQLLDSSGCKVGGGAGYTEWIENRMYPGDGEGWYIEDNIYTTTDCINGGCMIASGTNDGGGWVARYNKYSGTAESGATFAFESHGNQTSGIFAPQKTEIYGNNIHQTRFGTLHDARGGRTIVAYNMANADDADDIRVREEFNDDATSEILPTSGGVHNMCDEPDGDIQNCPRHFIGTTDSCGCGKVHDSYFWNNKRWDNRTEIGVYKGSDYDCATSNTAYCSSRYGVFPHTNDPLELVNDREYFVFVSEGFDGTTGMGCGTIEDMNAITPALPGVGFWVPTDMDTTPCNSISPDNLKQAYKTNVVTPISGTLYKWNGSSWVAGWTPYTYPHPLRAGADASPPAAPVELTIQ